MKADKLASNYRKHRDSATKLQDAAQLQQRQKIVVQQFESMSQSNTVLN